MAFDVMKNFGSNKEAEENGKEVQIGEGAFITIARSGNSKYNAMLAKAYEASKYVLAQKNKDSESRAETIMIDVMAKTVLLGWRGIELDGETLDYSVENAKRLLEIKDFRNMVSKQADDFSNFKLAAEEETAKN